MSVMTRRLYLCTQSLCLYILEILSQFLIHVLLWFTHVSFREPETIEEDLALVAQAMEMGIDPFPPKREKKRWGRMALGSFMIVLMVSWTSQFLMRFL